MVFLIIVVMLIISYVFKTDESPLNARTDSKRLLYRVFIAMKLPYHTVAEAQAAEREAVRTDVMTYLDELKRLIELELA